MLKSEVRAGVVAVLQDKLAVEPRQCNDDAQLFRDLGAESIDLLNVTFGIEQRFGIRVSDDIFPKEAAALTVGSLVDWVEQHVPQRDSSKPAH